MIRPHLPLAEIQAENTAVRQGTVLIRIPPNDLLDGYETVRVFVRVSAPGLRDIRLRTEGHPRNRDDGPYDVRIHYPEHLDRPGTLLHVLYTLATAGPLQASREITFKAVEESPGAGLHWEPRHVI